ncbi:MAG: sugar ABC transporter permease [Lachnospiraceae bacterium]|nr:sugar ABC transporter permease [Lachnospiraceae bacterium]
MKTNILKKFCTRDNISKYIRSYTIILATLIIWGVFQFLTKGTFLSIRNVSNLFRQMAVVGVLSIGMTVCLIAGNFDLSVGSVTGFLGAVSAYLITNMGLSPIISVIVAVIVGMVIGFWNGFWIAYQKVPAFIVTLGSSLIFKGGIFIITQGTTIPVREDFYLALGQKYISIPFGYFCVVAGVVLYIIQDLKKRKDMEEVLGQSTPIIHHILKYCLVGMVSFGFVLVMNLYEGIPIAVFIMFILLIILSFMLSKTSFGKRVYAVGGNSRASMMSGINNARISMITFVIMGGIAGLAGVLQTARLAAATPGAASGMELDAIASSVIGGVSLAGGSGKVYYAIVGGLVMASLSNGMSLLNVNSDVQYIVKGLILIIAVWFDVRIRNYEK